jgi:hypothetical protein
VTTGSRSLLPVAAAFVALLVATGGLATAALGDSGPCGVEARSMNNPRPSATDHPVWIFEPTGHGTSTIGGGRCDGPRRPAVFLAHGYAATDPARYRELIDHLVSVGNVVVYPTYDVKDFDADGDVDRGDLEESYRIVDAGIVAAVAATPRADTRRVGWWGHSHGGGMVPWLVQRGDGRAWGRQGVWMSNVAQAFTQLVGTGDIELPRRTQAVTVAFGDDAAADNRLGIDVFESLALPPVQKRHITVKSADHGAPFAADGGADAVDLLLWRSADLLQACAFRGRRCDADLSTIGAEALVSRHPVDSGPSPAVLAECDTGYAAPPFDLNPRRERCGPTRT